jgi:hypothetical protein
LVPPSLANPDADKLIERLLAARPRHHPGRTRADAYQAWELVLPKPRSQRMPRWYLPFLPSGSHVARCHRRRLIARPRQGSARRGSAIIDGWESRIHKAEWQKARARS